MEYRKVGKAGIKVSEVALGAWLTYGGSVDSNKSTPIIKEAIESGINFIDIADVYSGGEGEKVVGQAIKGMTRSDLVISSKLFWPMSPNINDRGLSRKHIMESIEKSLKRIGTDYIDLYFCHRFDPNVEIEETVRAMSDLVQQGKILYWGTSVWEADQIEQAVGSVKNLGGYLPSVEQPRYNMLDRHIEDMIMPACDRNGIGLTIWSPLAQGILTGKYNDGRPESSRGSQTEWLDNQLTDDNIEKVKKLTAVALDLKISMGQLALAWILRKSEISCVIVGATSSKQLQENIKASGIKLDDSTLTKINEILGDAPTSRFKF